MRYFFVDTENIGEYSFVKEMDISSNDTIVLFISEQSRRMKLEDLKLIVESKANIIYEDVYTGDLNALDFQLIACMSLMIANSNEDDEYILVSNDNDYKIPVKYLSKKTEKRISILNLKIGAPSLTKLDKVNITEALDNALEEALNFEITDTSEKGSLKEEILKMIEQSRALNVLHNNLSSKFGNNGKDIYKKIKPYIKSLYNI